VNIEALALINIAATISSHVNNSFLLDFPNTPVPVINRTNMSDSLLVCIS